MHGGVTHLDVITVQASIRKHIKLSVAIGFILLVFY